MVLVGYILYQRSHTRDIDAKIARRRQEINELNNEKAQAQAILNKPANRGIADQSEFLNELFARKSLSWTRIFSEMETIMPADLHVVSMKPEYTKNNELVVHMVVATDSRDRAVELVKRMEKSNHFRQPQIVAENVVGNTSATRAPGRATSSSISRRSMCRRRPMPTEAEARRSRTDQKQRQPPAKPADKRRLQSGTERVPQCSRNVRSAEPADESRRGSTDGHHS